MRTDIASWPPTRNDRALQTAGRRLAREFREWALVTPPLPAELWEALEPIERAIIAGRPDSDWFRWFLDGWEEERRQHGEG